MTDDDKPRFATAFATLAIAHREKSPDATMMRTYFESLRAVEIEFVLAAAERSMLRDWFPKVGEWYTTAATIERERREAQRAFLRTLQQPLCEICDDTGWTRGDDNRVRRCGCVAQRRLELLGRVPVALPESTAAPGETR
jgi:hypothetical protein